MHKGLDVSIYAKPELFPSPLEVDRFLYPNLTIKNAKKQFVSVPSQGG